QAHHQDRDIVLMAYSPLSRAERLDDAQLGQIAGRHGRTPAQVMIRWNLQRGTVPLPKANEARHIQENFAVFDFELSEDEMRRLDAMNEAWSALGSLVYQ
ncbi:MAG: aldo/keto reductase, partial [Pseudomonadota bacterium]|nr:aldo/keto reductase [Pseudomonadota bacterium]